MWNVSNQTLVFTEVIKDLQQKLSLEHCIFAPDLSWETSQAGVRSWEVQTEDLNQKDLPLLLWNRTPLIIGEHLQERGRRKAYEVDSLNEDMLRISGVFWGQCEIGCAFISNNVLVTEELELDFGTKILSHTQVRVRQEDGSDLLYTLEWSEIDSHGFSSKPYFHIASPFTVKVAGVFYKYQLDYPRLKTYVDALSLLYGEETTQQYVFRVPVDLS